MRDEFIHLSGTRRSVGSRGTPVPSPRQPSPVLRTSDLDYELPPRAVATSPAKPRDAARLLVVSRCDESILEHATVRDLPRFLIPNDLLILNTTKVLPARLRGARIDTRGGVEGLFLRAVDNEQWRNLGPGRYWIVLLRGGSLREGVIVSLMNNRNEEGGATLELVSRIPEETGGWLVRVFTPGPSATSMSRSGGATGGTATDITILGMVGHTPLPPYIIKARRDGGEVVEDAIDRTHYQSVFADQPGSVAAPTASLHLTEELLAQIKTKGVRTADVVLEVGTGTFKPVETEFVEQHPMHSEHCQMSRATREVITAARANGHRVICVGTTAARTVESFAATPNAWAMCETARMDTRLLITPGYTWLSTDGLLTNFHLPQSTLLALVAALFPGGIDRVKRLYQIALANHYRFFSYGDAMLILP